MILKCNTCDKYFDDQFRDTGCPHDTFSANDGQNNFAHYPDSWLADHKPRHERKYQEWLNNNKIRI